MNTKFMDGGQTLYILTQLIAGAIAAFLAILLWSKTRDIAWLLVIMGTIVSYIEIVYSILNIFGVTAFNIYIIGAVPLISFVLPPLRMLFFAAAFIIMIIKYARQK